MKALYDGTGVMVSENRMEQVTPDGEKRKKELIKKLEKATGKKYMVALKPIAITKEMLDDAEKLHKENKNSSLHNTIKSINTSSQSCTNYQ